MYYAATAKDDGDAKTSMLILGIAGSPRKQGNSAFLLQETLGHLQGGFQTETIFLKDLNIRPCEGCHSCESSGACRIEDDIPALSAKLKAADAVILATPSHMGGVTSRMQALMERTWPLRKGQMAGKVGASIVTGRRQMGMEIGLLDAYFSRLRMLRIPGILGFAFEAGRIVEDQEAISQTVRLADDIRRCLLGIRRKETDI